jgi:transposase
MARFDLSDAEWSIISPLLPNKPRGRCLVNLLMMPPRAYRIAGAGSED